MKKTGLITLYSSATILLLLIVIPILHPGNPKNLTYNSIEGVGISYEKLRDIQWNNLGNIPENNRVTIQGIAKYTHKGFKYVEHDYYAEKCENFGAGRLFVRYGDTETPLGIGDVRLNFSRDIQLPENGSKVIVTGKTKTGPFKEIIIDVESIENVE